MNDEFKKSLIQNLKLKIQNFKSVELTNVHSVYFIGIGGIGMSALARWFKANGFSVGGYDRSASALTNELAEEGMEIHYEESI